MEETPEHDLGRALSVNAEAIGEPGERRFRLLVRSTSETACVWMEKEQLAGIADWFDSMIERLEEDSPTGEPDVEPLPIDDEPNIEFTAGQLGLGYVEEEAIFALHAFDIERGAAGSPTLRFFLTRGQCRVLTRTITRVVAAGRPLCPLCELPMDPAGHVCPRSNGHYANARP